MDAAAVRRVAIAGINGQFGRVWARKLARDGVDIGGLDLQDSVFDPSICQSYVRSSVIDMTEAAERAIADAECVLLCLPEEIILRALPRLCDLMREDALLMDIASVKTRIGAALAGLNIRAGYLSIHPMFGPTDDFADRAVCLVPFRENPRARHVAAMIAGWGARLSELTAEQHDSATALVQALPHAALIAFGGTLDDSGVTFDLLWKIATPIQKIMLALAARVVSGEHDTYWSIQSANPFAATARAKLAAELETVSALVPNQPAFSAKLDSIRRYLSASEQALEELAAKFVSTAK